MKTNPSGLNRYGFPKVKEKYSFTGFFHIKLNAKRRITIPSDFRYNLVNRCLRLTCLLVEKTDTSKAMQGKILRIYPQKAWGKTLNRLSRKKRSDLLMASFEIKGLDNQNRLVIPLSLQKILNFSEGESLVIVGRGYYMDIICEKDWKPPAQQSKPR